MDKHASWDSLDDIFSTSAINIPSLSNVKTVFEFENDTISFIHNSYGYRSSEFDSVQDPYLLVAGCSLTEGYGLHLEQTWAVKLADKLNLNLVNLAKSGADSEFVSVNIFNWLSSKSKPQQIVIQWPNAFRAMHWSSSSCQFVNSANHDSLYMSKIQSNENNFWQSWIRNIILTDRFCRQLGIPTIHICLEDISFVEPVRPMLECAKIELHLDQKQPGLTWHFDSGAADKLHHSEFCNEKWAQRILSLI